MNIKICLYCKKEYNKKPNHSSKYWEEEAKYCSRRCGRMLNNPAKKYPNPFKDNGDGTITILIKSKGEEKKVLVDKKDYYNFGIETKRWTLCHGYPMCRVGGKKEFLHQVIIGCKEGFVVDHIDVNPLNNKRNNLRHLSLLNNKRNKKIRNITGVNGGRFTKCGAIRLRMTLNGREIYIGTYKTKEEAIEARCKVEKEHWGVSFMEEKLLTISL